MLRLNELKKKIGKASVCEEPKQAKINGTSLEERETVESASSEN